MDTNALILTDWGEGRQDFLGDLQFPGKYIILRKQTGRCDGMADMTDSKSSAVMDMPFLPNGLFMRFPEHSFAGAKSRSAILSVIFGGKAQKNFIFAGVSKLANEADSKSAVSNGLWVRVPPPAPRKWLSKPLFKRFGSHFHFAFADAKGRHSAILSAVACLPLMSRWA